MKSSQLPAGLTATDIQVITVSTERYFIASSFDAYDPSRARGARRRQIQGMMKAPSGSEPGDHPATSSLYVGNTEIGQRDHGSVVNGAIYSRDEQRKRPGARSGSPANCRC